MSAPTPAPAPRQRALKSLLLVMGTLATLAVVSGLVVAGWFYQAARASLPQLDGATRLPGLGQRVTVVRDQHGVPHLAAASMLDLVFAQGYVTAQDRLWQMDMSRRFASGEMAEVVGESMVQHDRQQRILLLRPTAERMVDSLDATGKSYLEAYARGVNTFMETHRNHLPIEFRMLRYQPGPWRPADSLVVGLYMSQLLNLREYKPEHEKVRAKLTSEEAVDLYPNSSWRDHPPGADVVDMNDTSSPEDDEKEDDTEPKARAAASPRLDGEVTPALAPGSNNWVVSGAHTVSGKPLLSNDMHLPTNIPNTWYEAQLQVRDRADSAPIFDVAGFTLPGVPFVIVGHNQRIAWGFTNLEPDVTDLYVETFNQDGEYRTPQGWKRPEVRHEIIHVKGRADVRMDVAITRHGPVVTELVPGETRKLALRWTLYDPGLSVVPFAEVDAAQNWEEFRRACSHFDSPSQNVVFADVDGHIGYQATGKIPIRLRGVSNLTPLPGDDNVHEWSGYVPYDKLPSVFDPPSGILATANNRIVRKKYPYVLTSDWYPPYRVDRIYHVLQSGRKFASADMLGLQMDIQSEYDRFCAERFVYAVDHAKQASARARAAADLMRSWDGRMTVEATAPVIETYARQALWRKLLEPKLGAEYSSYRWGLKAVALENILLHQPERWLPKEYANYEELLAAAVEEAVNQAGAPRDLGQWKWGEVHPLYLQHPLFGEMPVLRRWAGPGLKEQSGGAFTVKQVGRSFGASERMTVDLADLDNSTMNLVTGESGQFLSPHYMDQFRAWYEGQTFAFPFSDAAVKQGEQHELVLEPAGK